MRIAIIAFGTRGDVQPAIALGKGLQTAGHTVKVVAGTNFEQWVRGYGLDFAPTLDMELLMRSPEGIAWVEEPNPLRQLGHMKNLLSQNQAQLYSGLFEPAQDADLITSGFVSAPYAQAVSEKLGIPMINTLLQPYPPTRSGAASLTAVVHGDSILNRWMGNFSQRLIWWVGAETTNAFRAQIGLPPHTAASSLRAASAIPTIFGISPHVVPPPSDWGANSYESGYWFLDEAADYQPPADLMRFLEGGTPPVYVGFGSMSTSNPQATVSLIAEALEKTGRRGIIASGWGGAVDLPLPSHIFAVSSAPHDWLFERVAAVVHHGGAGTTAAGLRAGKPTFIIPHFSDQPFWGRRVYELGVGAKPVPRHSLTVEKLAAGIQTLMTDTGMQAKATELGVKIRAERGVDNAVQQIERLMSAKGF